MGRNRRGSRRASSAGGRLITPESIAERDPSEHGQQVALFCFAALQARTAPAWANIFAVPNGGHRHKAEAARLKASGVRAGVPDIFVAWPSGPYHGLFIELKIKGGRTSVEQDSWKDRLDAAGYRTAVCFGFQEARDEIVSYLALPS